MGPPSCHYHHTCCPEFRELADFLGHSEVTNDVKVQWLRPHTHMEWFTHSLRTYTRCFRPFICCGWADGSTILPLPSYLLPQNLGRLAYFLGHCEATNDVKVKWLRPHTHMEWFTPSLHTYTRCFRPFICCGWADGSTITPLPPYLLPQNLGSWLIS